MSRIKEEEVHVRLESWKRCLCDFDCSRRLSRPASKVSTGSSSVLAELWGILSKLKQFNRCRAPLARGEPRRLKDPQWMSLDVTGRPADWHVSLDVTTLPSRRFGSTIRPCRIGGGMGASGAALAETVRRRVAFAWQFDVDEDAGRGDDPLLRPSDHLSTYGPMGPSSSARLQVAG